MPTTHIRLKDIAKLSGKHKGFGQRVRRPTERFQKIEAGNRLSAAAKNPRQEDLVNNANEASGSDAGTTSRPSLDARQSPFPIQPSKSQMLSEGMLLDARGKPIISPILARDACKCADCIDPSDRQRNFSYANIPTDISFSSVSRNPKTGESLVRWRNDIPPHSPGKASIFDPDTVASLEKTFRNPLWSLYNVPQRLWDSESFTRETNRIDFNEYQNDDDALADTMYLLWRDGLVFVDGVPESDASVSQIVTRIGPLMNTFYGTTWDVKSVPDAKNVAYTAKYLGFHMDLLYMREPPAFQFLHCIHNESVGGESRFADTFKAVDLLYARDPAKVVALMDQHIRYEYDNDGYFYSDSKPTILRLSELNVPKRPTHNAQSPAFMSDVGRVHWSPPFVGDLQQTQHDELVRLVSASKAFSDILERPDMVVQEKMDSGTCVIFDNLRVVHARNAFDLNSGRRWLKGAYLGRQDFVSRASGLLSRFPVEIAFKETQPGDWPLR
ncbi:gamma-butyrobetaine dioxygenase [Cladophialophora carrionii]|uniref:Gamma-butyrobetaine dioxygenase n=1 Tax=Cladophialophora carrionii TaxID=86049 RepID=A0A1C1CSF1_9EURO|nr:gamma-butyrobetaine dioxygenase [Cladophialophora carrionii]